MPEAHVSSQIIKTEAPRIPEAPKPFVESGTVDPRLGNVLTRLGQQMAIGNGRGVLETLAIANEVTPTQTVDDATATPPDSALTGVQDHLASLMTPAVETSVTPPVSESVLPPEQGAESELQRIMKYDGVGSHEGIATDPLFTDPDSSDNSTVKNDSTGKQIDDVRNQIQEHIELTSSPESELSQEIDQIVDEYCSQELEKRLAANKGFIDRNRVSVANLQALVDMKSTGANGKHEAFLGKLNIIDKVMLKKINLTPEDFVKVCFRMELMGIRVYNNDPTSLLTLAVKNGQMRNFIHAFATADNSQFQNFCDQLNPYFFLDLQPKNSWPKGYEKIKDRLIISAANRSGYSYANILNPNIGFFTELLQSGALTPDQKKALDMHSRIFLLGAESEGVFNEEMVTQRDPYGICNLSDSELLQIQSRLNKAYGSAGNLLDSNIEEKPIRQEVINEIITFFNFSADKPMHYRNLSQFLKRIHVMSLPSSMKTKLVLRAVAAHKKSQENISDTQIEDIEMVKQSAAELFREDMSRNERMSLTLLREEIPFTSDESVRDIFRELAIVVEKVDGKKLSWVHQVVHNYASTHTPQYLRALRTFIETGDQSELEKYRNYYDGRAQAPNYSEKDRIVLQKKLSGELDQLIEYADKFYEINPEGLKQRTDYLAMNNLFTKKPELKQSLLSLHDDLLQLKPETGVDKTDREQSAYNFLMKANGVREQVMSHAIRASGDNKRQLVTLDAIIAGMYKKVAVEYITLLQDKEGGLQQQGLASGLAVFGELARASYLNGEVDKETYESSKLLNNALRPENIDSDTLHGIQLHIPIIQKQMETDWQAFARTATHEMTAALIASGMSQREAKNQVVHTYLVDIKKNTILFISEPLIKILKRSVPEETLHQRYGRLQENVDPIKYNNPEVDDVIQTICGREIPDDLQEAHEFLTELATSPEGQAEPLARAVVPGYKGEHIQFEKDGALIELYPFDNLGKSLMIILKDGVRVENPKDFLMKQFEVVPAVVKSLKEGD